MVLVVVFVSLLCSLDRTTETSLSIGSLMPQTRRLIKSSWCLTSCFQSSTLCHMTSGSHLPLTEVSHSLRISESWTLSWVTMLSSLPTMCSGSAQTATKCTLRMTAMEMEDIALLSHPMETSVDKKSFSKILDRCAFGNKWRDRMKLISGGHTLSRFMAAAIVLSMRTALRELILLSDSNGTKLRNALRIVSQAETGQPLKFPTQRSTVR